MAPKKFDMLEDNLAPEKAAAEAPVAPVPAAEAPAPAPAAPVRAPTEAEQTDPAAWAAFAAEMELPAPFPALIWNSLVAQRALATARAAARAAAAAETAARAAFVDSCDDTPEEMVAAGARLISARAAVATLAAAESAAAARSQAALQCTADAAVEAVASAAAADPSRRVQEICRKGMLPAPGLAGGSSKKASKPTSVFSKLTPDLVERITLALPFAAIAHLQHACGAVPDIRRHCAAKKIQDAYRAHAARRSFFGSPLAPEVAATGFFTQDMGLEIYEHMAECVHLTSLEYEVQLKIMGVGFSVERNTDEARGAFRLRCDALVKTVSARDGVWAPCGFVGVWSGYYTDGGGDEGDGERFLQEPEAWDYYEDPDYYAVPRTAPRTAADHWEGGAVEVWKDSIEFVVHPNGTFTQRPAAPHFKPFYIQWLEAQEEEEE
jgi:hypothetical protein